jgi:hypothetical protein
MTVPFYIGALIFFPSVKSLSKAAMKWEKFFHFLARSHRAKQPTQTKPGRAAAKIGKSNLSSLFFPPKTTAKATRRSYQAKPPDKAIELESPAKRSIG